MKRIIQTIAAAAFLGGIVNAQEAVLNLNGVSVDSLKVEKSSNDMIIDMTLDFSELKIPAKRAITFIPRLVSETDSVDLKPITFYGRQRYLYYQRQEFALGGEGEIAYKSKDKPEKITYSDEVDYQPWMGDCKLALERRDCGCCGDVLGVQRGETHGYKEYLYQPMFAFVSPKAELEKTRELKGSAFIDFVVSKTDIRPEYRGNRRELAKITGTIDSVKNDTDIKVIAISIKGYASPESPYSNNTRLAKGRTKSLCEYVSKLYDFPEGFIKTSYEPEDWEGLRRYVGNSSLEHKDEILALIDSDREPDNKEWAIKSSYPKDYRYLLDNCYPALRHSDYKIDYTIRNYTDVEEIKNVLSERPQKLSLRELYIVAQTYEPGSDEYNEVFEVAVRMFPTDEVANLNAANTAMGKGDMKSAQKYLAKSGNSPEAEYARGVYKALNKDFAGAAEIFQKVENRVPQAAETLKILSENKLIKLVG